MESLRQRGVTSPDEGDAVALCFTEPNGSPVPRSIAMNFNRPLQYKSVGRLMSRSKLPLGLGRSSSWLESATSEANRTRNPFSHRVVSSAEHS